MRDRFGDRSHDWGRLAGNVLVQPRAFSGIIDKRHAVVI
jgi:hypothetical protein